MTEYESVIETAEDEAAKGRFKEAYNTLSRAMLLGGARDREIRYLRGICALNVGRVRMDHFEDQSESPRTLIKAGCWLARAEAYLASAREGASAEEVDQIEAHLEATKHQQERFRRLAHASTIDVFEDV